MKIKSLNKKEFKNQSYAIKYETTRYYKIEAKKDSFTFKLIKFDNSKEYALQEI